MKKFVFAFVATLAFASVGAAAESCPAFDLPVECTGISGGGGIQIFKFQGTESGLAQVQTVGEGTCNQDFYRTIYTCGDAVATCANGAWVVQSASCTVSRD